MMEQFTFKSIGVVRTLNKFKFESPRQGVFTGSCGYIELFDGYGGDAIRDLEGFERIWILFCFHHNLDKNWKALVRPPVVPQERRYSVFATRSPYRPNPLGMSCVRLLELHEDRLLVGNIDLLDGTPVLDIKPYIPQVDAFTSSRAGWRDELACSVPQWEITFSQRFLDKAGFIRSCGAPDMVNFCQVQLQYNPLDRSRKRLFECEGTDELEIGCRTWRIRFSFDRERLSVHVSDLRSNYCAAELVPEADDIYGDKEIHRKFVRQFEK